MRRALVCLFLTWIIVVARAGPLPMTARDVGLMLRAGYSSPAVMQELSVRHFADALDAPKERMLVQAGASADLISALKNGTYSLSPEQTAIAQQQMVDQARRRQMEADASRKFDTLYQSQLADKRRAAVALPNANGNAIHQLVKGDLVSWHNGSLVHLDDEALADKKLIALYFSAHWCGPCRKFTPLLVDYYNHVAPQHPEFEIIFVSLDKSQFGMETYIRETNMPWPAVDYQKLVGKDAIKKYAGEGIPCLVLVDASGKVISDSYAGKQHLGPEKVLADLNTIFAGNTAAHVAANR